MEMSSQIHRSLGPRLASTRQGAELALPPPKRPSTPPIPAGDPGGFPMRASTLKQRMMEGLHGNMRMAAQPQTY